MFKYKDNYKGLKLAPMVGGAKDAERGDPKDRERNMVIALLKKDWV